ncbi:MAG: hypothetical protein H6622_16590 [Halobacteriovoraceae bacterium]|nr:hypothetical protein [Halobacteriovoraceae bacterium]
MRKIFLILIFNCLNFQLFASIQSSDQILHKILQEFLMQDEINLSSNAVLSVNHRRPCLPDEEQRISCFEASCKYLGRNACDGQDDYLKIKNYCLGNQNGECVERTCQYLDRHKCDDHSEIEAIASSCRGNISALCLEVSVKFLDRYEYDDISEIQQINHACRNNYDGGSCLRYLCDKAGRYHCDDLEEVVKILNICGGEKHNL